MKLGIQYYQLISKPVGRSLQIKIYFSKRRREKKKKKDLNHQRHNSVCEHSMDLPLINDVPIDKIENSIVMLETSGDTWLIAR